MKLGELFACLSDYEIISIESMKGEDAVVYTNSTRLGDLAEGVKELISNAEVSYIRIVDGILRITIK